MANQGFRWFWVVMVCGTSISHSRSTDGDGVDVDEDGCLNRDGKLTSVDALMILQAAAGTLNDIATGCGELDQRVLRMYDQNRDGWIDDTWMQDASIDVEYLRITKDEYEQVKYAYEHQCPVEPE